MRDSVPLRWIAEAEARSVCEAARLRAGQPARRPVAALLQEQARPEPVLQEPVLARPASSQWARSSSASCP